MDRLIYTALSGLRRAEFAQGVVANNLANASTVGFRRDAAAFESQWLDGTGTGSRVQAGSELLGTDMAPGPLISTGRTLDVALRGDAMLAVEAEGGGEAYSRRGDLSPDADGVLRTGDGRAVLGEAGPITVPPAAVISIAEDGVVSYRSQGDPAGAELAEAGRLKLVSLPAGTAAKGIDGLFRRLDRRIADTDPAARLSPGALEGSNISPVAALTDLIEQSRGFEVQTRLVSEMRELDRASSQLMQIDK